MFRRAIKKKNGAGEHENRQAFGLSEGLHRVAPRVTAIQAQRRRPKGAGNKELMR
jgi:hypothetical protein